MIHTSKDAQATAAICSCGQNPWKAKLREATSGLIAGTQRVSCCLEQGMTTLWRDTQAAGMDLHGAAGLAFQPIAAIPWGQAPFGT